MLIFSGYNEMRMKEVVTILMESPFYFRLSLEERFQLVKEFFHLHADKKEIPFRK